jgi:hypothetical protein
MPLVYMFQNYIEKVLMLLTRLSEKEARNEMSYFMKFQQILLNKNESYFKKNFLRSKKEGEGSSINNTEKKKQDKRNNNSSYISNKIQNSNLNRIKNFGLNFISLLTSAIYFAIYFILISQLKQQLNYSIQLNNQSQ